MSKLRREEIEEAKRLKEALNREMPRVFFDQQSPANISVFKRLINYGYSQYANGIDHTQGCELGYLGEEELELFIETGMTRTERNQREEKLKEEQKEKFERETIEISKKSNKLSEEANHISKKSNRLSILAIMISLVSLGISLMLNK